MPPETALTGNENRTICGQCGGRCCHTRPGIEAPQRFLGSRQGDDLGALLRNRSWVLETHYGKPYTPGVTEPAPELIIRYPRPATMAETGTLTDETAPDACIYLEAQGCRLDFAQRPRMCRELEPDSRFECRSGWDRRQAALDWLHYQHLIDEALKAAERDKETV